jgi:hypothetical protein
MPDSPQSEILDIQFPIPVGQKNRLVWRMGLFRNHWFSSFFS